MKKLIIAVIVILVLALAVWWWGKAPVSQAPTTGAVDTEISSINEEISSLDLGNVTSDFQAIDSDLNVL